MMYRNIVLLCALIALAISPFLGLPGWKVSLATVALFTAISLIGVNLIFGYCGMLTLGQAAFAAVPGYASGILFGLGVPNVVAILIGLLATIVIARLIAEVFVRLPGIYLAVGTLGFAYVVEGLARAFPSVTGGASGLVLTPPVVLSEIQWYALAVVSVAVAYGSVALYLRGAKARMLQVIHRDELAAAVIGIDVNRIKIRMFTLGSVYTAIGGLLLVYYTSVLAPETGGANMSLEYLATVIIGGVGSVLGPLVGAILLNWLFAVSGGAGHFELLVYGCGFLAVILFAPSGLMGLVHRLFGPIQPVAPAAADVAARAPRPQAARPAAGQVVLQASNVSKRFGGVQAVRNVDLTVCAGEIVGLLGPNGAGKSTFFNLLMGIDRPNEGTISLNGTDITDRPIHERAASIGRAFQVPRLVNDMTVLENVVARADQLHPDLSETERLAMATALLDDFDLTALATKRVGDIAVGLHKLVDVARAALGNLVVVLLDEPAVGLSANEVARLTTMIHSLRDRGSAVVVVDHNIDFVMAISDKILVMEMGAPIAFGAAAEVTASERVQRAYLGVLQ